MKGQNSVDIDNREKESVDPDYDRSNTLIVRQSYVFYLLTCNKYGFLHEHNVLKYV